MNTQPSEEALFQAAAQLAGPDRAAFLDRECAGDPALRARLDALLAAHEQSDGVLCSHPEASRPTINLELADLPDSAVGQTIGRYKLLENIGDTELHRLPWADPSLGWNTETPGNWLCHARSR